MDPLPSSSSYPHSYLPPYPFQEHPFYIPIILYLYTFSTDSLPHPNAPIHIVYWACPPTPHFRFFGTIYGHFFATITFPHHYSSCIMIPEGPAFPGYSIPAPCPCLPPLFSPFWCIYGLIFACIAIVFHIYMYIHDLYP